MEDSLFATILLPIALAVIMVSLGLSLTVADFRRVVAYPRGVGVGMLNLALISPALAFAAAELWSLEPALAVGLVLLGASPGGTTANMLTHLARGDTALSVTMTAISSVAAVVTVPLYLGLATAHFDAEALDQSVDMLGVVARVLLITVVPLAVGMLLRARSPERVEAIEPRVKRIALAVFVAVVIGAIIAENERVLDNLGEVAPGRDNAQRRRHGRVVRDRASRRARRSPDHGGRDRARRPQRDPRNRDRRLDLSGADDPGRRLQRLHVRLRGAVRAPDVPAQRARRMGRTGIEPVTLRLRVSCSTS